MWVACMSGYASAARARMASAARTCPAPADTLKISKERDAMIFLSVRDRRSATLRPIREFDVFHLRNVHQLLEHGGQIDAFEEQRMQAFQDMHTDAELGGLHPYDAHGVDPLGHFADVGDGFFQGLALP